MLKTRITYQTGNPAEYIQALTTSALDKLVTTEVREETKEVSVSFFPKKLSYAQYALIHRFLIILAEKINGRIFDKGSMLGYLQDGTPAYIVTNWDEWSRFFYMRKKLHSSQGEYVHVYANSELLESGILLEYEMSKEGEAFAITSCTLLTSEGETTLHGEALVLEAEQRF
ncbi:hypothetical protein GCM10020331_030200 [Ectobacillus funiculus]